MECKIIISSTEDCCSGGNQSVDCNDVVAKVKSSLQAGAKFEVKIEGCDCKVEGCCV